MAKAWQREQRWFISVRVCVFWMWSVEGTSGLACKPSSYEHVVFMRVRSDAPRVIKGTFLFLRFGVPRVWARSCSFCVCVGTRSSLRSKPTKHLVVSPPVKPASGDGRKLLRINLFQSARRFNVQNLSVFVDADLLCFPT